MKPYYDEDGITIYHADCLEILPNLTPVGTLVTDPPYGVSYHSNRPRLPSSPRSIAGDDDTSARDEVLAWWSHRPALVFGTWRRPIPPQTNMLLIWDTKGALGMGDVRQPWKPSHQQIYVLGHGFGGRRTSDVLTFAPVQSLGRSHPHEKPVDLMRELIGKCFEDGPIIDPFMGSGSTLRAAKDLGRRAIGIEIEERYCEIAARRLSQQVLELGSVT